MVLKKKTPDFLALLTARVEGAFPVILVVPQPPTPAPMCASLGDAADKKRKWGQGGKGFKAAEEG